MGVQASAWLDVEAAAAHLGMSIAFVRKLVLEHRIRYYKVGQRLRFDPQDLDDFIRAGRVEPRPVVAPPRWRAS